MTDEQAKPIANYVCSWVYQYLISKTGTDRVTALRAARNAANKAAQSLQNDLAEQEVNQ